MPRVILAVLLMLLPPVLVAQEAVRYVSDELVIVMRSRADASSTVIASLNTGTKLRLLGAAEDSGYVNVRLDDGRTGWVQKRYLDARPPARLRVDDLARQLASAEAELKTLRDEQAHLRKQLEQAGAGQPLSAPPAVAGELAALRTQVSELRQQNESLVATGSQARDRQRTLALGGGLVVVGFVLAWLIRWLWPKRRWGEL